MYPAQPQQQPFPAWEPKQYVPPVLNASPPIVPQQQQVQLQAEAYGPYSTQMETMKAMGFDNMSKAVQLLSKHNGNLEHAIEEYLNMQ